MQRLQRGEMLLAGMAAVSAARLDGAAWTQATEDYVDVDLPDRGGITLGEDE